MTKNETTSAIIDSLLKFMAVGGLITTTVLAPNAIQALDKPLKAYFNKLDKRSRDREYQRCLRYMKRQGLITYTAYDYEHGIQLTETGEKRAKKADLEVLAIPKPPKWDGKWRIVMFDIPEKYKTPRDYLSRKLKQLGMIQLQKSVWVYPFTCREEVEVVALTYGVSHFVTYIETGHIDSQQKLKERFSFKF